MAAVLENENNKNINTSEEDAIFKSSSYGICFHCSKLGKKMKCCSGCKSAWYCCVEHQKVDYPTHKSECRLLRKLKKTKSDMTGEKCKKLITYLLKETIKVQEFEASMELAEDVLTEQLKRLEELRALFFQIVSWDQHIRYISNDFTEILMFITSYRFCLLKHSELFVTLFSLEKQLPCKETITRNYLRGSMYENFWLEKTGQIFDNDRKSIDMNVSMFNVDKERLLGEVSLLQKGGEDSAYYHYLGACKINDKIRLILSQQTNQEGENKNFDKTKNVTFQLLSVQQNYYYNKQVTNNGPLLRKMMHCMARQENFEGADHLYEQAIKAFDELEEEESGGVRDNLHGKKGKKLALKFERAGLYQFGALQIMNNANDLLKSGVKKNMAEYKEPLELMQQEMIALIQKSAKEFIFVIAVSFALTTSVTQPFFNTSTIYYS